VHVLLLGTIVRLGISRPSLVRRTVRAEIDNTPSLFPRSLRFVRAVSGHVSIFERVSFIPVTGEDLAQDAAA
jgi:hypothetical protein